MIARTIRVCIHWAGVTFVVGLLATGCLPHSCQREPSQALYPSDSLSRRVARETPADTLERLWETAGKEGSPFRHPRTVRFLDDGRLAVSDVERNRIVVIDPSGSVSRAITDSAFAVPYLIGTRGDTLVVFNAEADRINFVTRSGRVAQTSISYDRPASGALVYMAATATDIYAKAVGRNVDSFVGRLNTSGEIAARVPLTGPYWRHAGFLRVWGDSLVSLSGFRPVVDLLPVPFSDEARPDTLALVGFDSPMLERSYAFAKGNVTKAPLLTPTAAPVGNTLFVLNLRPGWIQIDAYNREGRLQRRLIERHEEGNPQFYPLDMDVRRTSEGYLFALTIRSPEPQVELYRWTPPDLVLESGSSAGSDRAR